VVGKSGKRLSALACCATGETDDYTGCDIVVVAVEYEEGWMNGALIKRADQECALAGRVRLEEPMDADDGELKGRRGNGGVSGP
jgi:hypothetical protein